MTLINTPSPWRINPPQTPPFLPVPLPPPLPAPPLALAPVLSRREVILHCNQTKTIMISNKRIISTDRETIPCIFMRDKYYRMKSKLSMNNSTMLRRRILMNTCISTKRGDRVKKNATSSIKKTTTMTMITKKMKTRSESGIRSLTGIFLRTLYYPYM